VRFRFLVAPAAACLALVGLVPAGPAAPAGANRAAGPGKCPWLDTNLPTAQRVSLVLAQMTLAEKLDLMHGNTKPSTNGSIGSTPAIPRLCIPEVTQEDGPAGVADGVSGATQLPAPVNMAATFDPAAARAYGQVIGAEEWTKGNEVVYAPTINIDRDPRWGRNFESLSEDPYLTGTLATSEIQGIQAQGPIAQVKHYAVYNQETNRNTLADAPQIDQRTSQEIYLPAFYDSVVKGKAGSVMCSYSAPNGTFACENASLLQILEQRWPFAGWVGSDYGATHSTVASANAGLGQEQPETTYFGAALAAAVNAGQVSEATINDAVTRILTEMFRFGLFNHKPTGNESTPASTPAHVAFAQENSEKGTVLLQNNGNVLPLASTTSSIAVIGADGSTSPMTAGGGSAAVTASSVITPLQGIAARAGSGVDVTSYAGTTPSAAAATARAAQVAIVFAGNFESEGSDLPNITLQGNQNAVISAVARANPHTIVVLNTGGPVTMPWLSQVAGVLEAWYPGQQDGAAIASVLFGDSNPSGHLPETFPASLSQIPTASKAQFPGVNGKVAYSEGLKVGYRYYDTTGVMPLFPFGYGLSYTSFAYSNLHLSTHAVANDVSGPGGGQSSTIVTATATVTNTGTRAGSDVAQLYLGDPASVGEPARQLEGYQRVTLQSGQSATVRFPLTGHALSYFDTSANGWVVPDGDFTVYVGDSSALANLPLQQGFTVTRSVGARSATMTSPATVAPTASFTATVAFANNGDYPLSNAEAILSAPAGWTVTPQGRVPSQVLAHQTITVSWTVTVPEAAQATTAALKAELRGVTGSGNPATAFSVTAQTAVSPLVTASAPGPLTVKPGSSATATVTLTSQIPRSVTVQVNATAPAGISVTPAAQTVTVSPSGTPVVLTVRVPSTTRGGTFSVSLTLSATDRGRTFTLPGTAFTVTVPFSSLAAAFNNTGIANESDPASANFDGSGYSYSEQQLISAGFAPGTTVTHDGITYMWPSSAPGTPDNVVAGGQTIDVGGSGAHLGILAAANNGTAMGPVTVNYTDGTSTSAQISVADWYANQAAPGGDILVTTPNWNQPPGGIGNHPVSIYATSVPIDPNKTVASVMLPAVSNGIARGVLALHIFALAAG
jgi:beta-glucosidase